MWKLLCQSEAVEDLIELLQQDPRQARRVPAPIIAFGRSGEGDIKALRGRSDEVRLRVGDWRVIIERTLGRRVLRSFHEYAFAGMLTSSTVLRL